MESENPWEADPSESEREHSESPEREDIRQLILQQLACVESSDISDEESYRVRLSCILEGDESESSTSQGRIRDVPKNELVSQKMRERDKTDEEQLLTGESESSDNMTTLREGIGMEKHGRVPVTDLDEISLQNSHGRGSPSEKTQVMAHGNEIEDTEEEEEGCVDSMGEVPFEIKKLKSSDNVLKNRLEPDSTEFSSDSSDVDISISNEKPFQLVQEAVEKARGAHGAESFSSREEPKTRRENPVFAKISRNYMDKRTSEEDIDEGDSRVGSVERELMEGLDEPTETKMILQVVHLRSKSPRTYTPPVPPETYLWEELKRIRGKGGYPWTYLDKPPFDEAVWKKYMEHEYEPINPPPLSSLRSYEKDEVTAEKGKELDVAGTDVRFPGVFCNAESIKNENDDVVPEVLPMARETKNKEDLELEDMALGEQLQDREETRHLAQTPTTTSASRTDCDVNTSMLDSSGLEDIPLERDSRNKIRARTRSIQQKLRSQAGKIRNTLKSLPKRHMQDISKDVTATEKSRLRLPERRKFKLPEKAKFNLPERPKFKFPVKGSFNFPDSPKIHLPERPKLHMPQRPKFNLRERPKLHLPEMSRFHLPERPKLHLPERPKIRIPHFVKPLRERQNAGLRRNMFELDFKGYPKLFTKKTSQRGEHAVLSSKTTRGITPPPKMQLDEPCVPQRKKLPLGQRWLKKMDIKYADENGSNVVKSRDLSESIPDLGDKYMDGYLENFEDGRYNSGDPKALSDKSSVSHISERDVDSIGGSEGRLRKGVLEEINSDEFFLRQKGISQEDIDMGKYLSHEIREAFRSPEVNALARMSYEYDDMNVKIEPTKPERRSSSKKTNLKKSFESDPALSDNSSCQTYAPRRPQRSSRSQSKSLVNEDAAIEVKEQMYLNEALIYQEDNTSEYYKSPGPVKEYQHYKVPRFHGDTEPVPCKRKRAWKKRMEDATGSETSLDQSPPQPLVRKKSKRKINGEEAPMATDTPAQNSGDSKERKCIEDADPDGVTYEAPELPRRTRTLVRSMQFSKSLRSIGSAEIADPSVELSLIPTETQSLSHVEIARHEVNEDDPGFGYATIGKPILSRPVRHKKLTKKLPPTRKLDSMPSFCTIPRHVPIRPIRNYSTLGPSRPPRKTEVKSRDREQKSLSDLGTEIETKPLRCEECHGSNKNLQKEEIIEKMKGRPLPPPPRPPRLKSRGPEDAPDMEITKEEQISMALLKDETLLVDTEAMVHTLLDVAVEEVSTATQTDPLPDDFLLDFEEDMIQEFSQEKVKQQKSFLKHIQVKKDAGMYDVSVEDGLGEATQSKSRKEVTDKTELTPSAELNMEVPMASRGENTAEVEAPDTDLGYASLDRKQNKQEPEASSVNTSQHIRLSTMPDMDTNVNVLRTNKLDVKELEVEKLKVRELQVFEMNVNDLHTDQVTASNINTSSGNLTLGSIELPPNFIHQVFDRIALHDLRQSPNERTKSEGLPIKLNDSERENNTNSLSPVPPLRHCNWERDSPYAEEDENNGVNNYIRRKISKNPSVAELSRQLAAACAASGVRAMRGIASRIDSLQIQDKPLLLHAILCILVIFVAIFLMLGTESKTVHHHWDFQFPPQPPREF